jgi:hypothetical protein
VRVTHPTPPIEGKTGVAVEIVGPLFLAAGKSINKKNTEDGCLGEAVWEGSFVGVPVNPPWAPKNKGDWVGPTSGQEPHGSSKTNTPTMALAQSVQMPSVCPGASGLYYAASSEPHPSSRKTSKPDKHTKTVFCGSETVESRMLCGMPLSPKPRVPKRNALVFDHTPPSHTGRLTPNPLRKSGGKAAGVDGARGPARPIRPKQSNMFDSQTKGKPSHITSRHR